MDSLRLIDDWHKLIWKLWSIKVAILWAALSGLAMAWPAFMGLISPFAFAGISMFFAVLLVVARLTKQPGVE